MTVTVVPIRAEHVEAHHALLVAIAREHAHLAMAPPPPLARHRTNVLAVIGSGLPHLVALDDVRLVGWCDATPRDRRTPMTCGILGMGLSADRRGLGLGERLIRATLALCSEFGYEHVELTVHARNTPAVALYRKVGFLPRPRAQASVTGEFLVMAHPLDCLP